MPAKNATPPRLVHVANLWTLWDHPAAKNDWSLDKKFAAIKEAGFDAYTALLDPQHSKLAAKHGLLAIGYFASSKSTEFRKLILQNRDNGALRINVHLGIHNTPVEEAIRLAIRLFEESEKLGCPCDIEVHRGTALETPEKTYAIADGFKKVTGQLLPITWDFSHIATVKHLEPPYWERLLVMPKLVQHARQFHFRPFNGHHCQIPVTDGTGKLSVEFQQWMPFLEKTMEMILAGKSDGRDLYVCPEMGPVRGGYNFAQLPSSWEDAKLLRGIIEKTWKKSLAARANTA